MQQKSSICREVHVLLGSNQRNITSSVRLQKLAAAGQGTPPTAFENKDSNQANALLLCDPGSAAAKQVRQSCSFPGRMGCYRQSGEDKQWLPSCVCWWPQELADHHTQIVALLLCPYLSD